MRTLAYVYTCVQRERENKSKQIAKHCYFVLCFEIFFSPVDAVAPGWGPMEVGEVFQTALIVQMIDHILALSWFDHTQELILPLKLVLCNIVKGSENFVILFLETEIHA